MSLETFEKVLSRWLPSTRHNDQAATPGVQVVVVASSGMVYSGARGMADLFEPSREPVTTHHDANLYSLTKFFTACCILKLMDQGKLSLSTRARDVLPEYLREHVNDCTIQQLLTHTAGAPNPLPLSWIHGVNEEIHEEQELLDVLKKHPFPPLALSSHSKYKYSNVGYWVLGAILSHVCHKTMTEFAQICNELLLDNAKLSQDEFKTKFDLDKKNPMIQTGHVYKWSLLGMLTPCLVPRWILAGKQHQPSKWSSWRRMELHYLNGSSFGGLISSSNTVAMFLSRILQHQVLSPTLLQLLFQQQNPQMTCGLHVRSQNGMRVFHKEGGGAGCHSSIHFRPHDDLAACVIAGDAEFDVNGLLDELLNVAVEQQQVANKLLNIASQTKYVKASDESELHTTSYYHAKNQNGTKPILADPILLIHGGPGVPDYLEPLAHVLLESNIASKIITFDQRGVGKSRQAQSLSNLSMDLMVNDMECIRQAHHANKLHVMGHSWGGCLARLYTAQHSRHVSSLVLLSPSPILDASQWSTMETAVMKENLRKCGSWKFTLMGLYSLLMFVPLSMISDFAARRLFTQVIQNYYYDPTTAPTPPRLFLKGISARACIATKAAFVKSVNKTSILVPTRVSHLVVFGDDDIYGNDLVETFSQFHSVQMMSDAGHLSWLDQPKAFKTILSNFYSSNTT